MAAPSLPTRDGPPISTQPPRGAGPFPRRPALDERVEAIYEQIVATPARSLAGLLGQLELLRELTGKDKFIDTITAGVKCLAGGVKR
jgi:hypothetical protein